jgi:hypothetical protein
MPDPLMGPFGNPDGARSNLTSNNGFVLFEDERVWGALATKADDRRARIFVGRKGSGKTLFLRQMNNAAKRDRLYTVAIHEAPPATELVVDFCKRFSQEGHLSEKWGRVWRCAIFRSLVSHLLKSKELSSRLPEEIKETLATRFSELLREFMTPVSICSQVEELLQVLRSVREMNSFLYHPLWEDLRTVVAAAFDRLPAVILFVDAIDDAFDRAPWFWLRCQHGLLRAVLQLLHDGELANQFHVVIALRDVVFVSDKDTEHGVRRDDETYFRILKWDKRAIDFFLGQKLKTLDKIYFRGQPDVTGKTVASWIGISEIWNPKYKQNEPIDRYLLRHTRMLPRDVVVLGNHLCQALADESIATKEQISACVRRVVSECAAKFGNEQLRICSNEIVSQMIPHGMTGTDQYSAFLDNPSLTDAVTEDIRNVIRGIGSNRFGRDKLGDARAAWNAVLEDKYDIAGSDLFEVLWRNQLLGCNMLVDQEPKDVFFTDHRPGAGLPFGDQYVFHPVVTDILGVNGTGEEPVVPLW